MPTVTIRKRTEEEQRLVEHLYAQHEYAVSGFEWKTKFGERWKLITACLLTFVLIIPLLALHTQRPATVLLISVGLCPFVYMAIMPDLVLFRTPAERRSLQKRRNQEESVLDCGEIAQTTYEIVDAIEVEEEGDLGANFFCLLKDGQVLLLSGQMFYGGEGGKELNENPFFPGTPSNQLGSAFPCERYSILTLLSNRQVVREIRGGNYVKPSHTFGRFKREVGWPPFEKHVIANDVLFQGSYLSIPWDELPARLAEITG